MSGMPMIQFSLVSMLQLVDEGIFTLETIVENCIIGMPDMAFKAPPSFSESRWGA